MFFAFFEFLRPFWGPGGIPLDSQRNFDPPQDLNTPGSFFWTHFSNFLTFVLGFYKKSGFHFSEPDLLIRKEIKYPDPCHPLRKTLLCRQLRISAWFMTPTIHFFIFCSATLTIRAKSGLRPCSYYFPELIQKLVSELSYFRINSESFVVVKVL